MTMTRQQARQQERVKQKIADAIVAFRKKSPMAETTFQHGYADGWKEACEFCMKTCYAASTLALHDLEGYGFKRNRRFLRKMDDYVVNTLSKEEIVDEALQKAGVYIDFREPFERVVDA